MKFSLVNWQRQETQPSLSDKCPVCDQPTVAKCGEVKIWHWAHKGRRICDRWWEIETEWHRAWKGQFPEDWQEVVHKADSGEKHIADVKTDKVWVIEFQHSLLGPEERRSRDAFYPKLVWVVDGARRKRDSEQFRKAFIRGGAPHGFNPQIRTVLSDECAV
jgi:competence protein CoiA